MLRTTVKRRPRKQKGLKDIRQKGNGMYFFMNTDEKIPELCL